MRAYLTIRAKKAIIPIDHRDQLIQCIHNWLELNSPHEDVPPYSFSRFEGTRNTREGMHFSEESAFFFSSPNENLVHQLQKGIQKKPELFMGLTVSEVKLIPDPDLSSRELFYAAGPLVLKQGADDFMVYNDAGADAFLKEHTIAKLLAAGIHDESFDLYFDKKYTNAGTKKISYKEKTIRASWCQVIIKGLPETKNYVWHVGLGDYTALGFGAIM